MATPGLASVGFMTKDYAVQFLGCECAPVNPDPAVLEAEWTAAVAAIGPAPANAGNPAISDLPAAYQPYAQQLQAVPDWQHIFAVNPHWQIKMVEIAPLLAFQFSVLNGKTNGHGVGLSSPPTIDELLQCCLPMTSINEGYVVTRQHASALIQARSLNVRPINFGETAPGVFSLQIGVSLPFVHVVRFNGLCFLHNGYHRACAALAAGATEIPCVFRDVSTEAEIGIAPPGTFDFATLTSNNPPTLQHLANGHAVNLVVKTRTVHLSWTDWVTPEI